MILTLAYIETFSSVPPDVVAAILAFLTAIIGWIARGFKSPKP